MNEVASSIMNRSKVDSENTRLIVKRADANDSRDWTEFVNRHPDASVFHDWKWLEIIHSSFQHENLSLIARRGAAVVGVLPLMEVKTWLFGHSLVSLPFCQWAGCLALDPQAENELRSKAIELAQTVGVSHLEFRTTAPGECGLATQDQLYVIFRKEMSADHDANLKSIPRKQRAMVRKGISNGLSSEQAEVDEFYEMYTDNVHRHGTPCAPKKFFESIQIEFGNDCEVTVIRGSDGQGLSSVLTLYWRNEVFPFYAGDTPQARQSAANDFKYWSVMQRGVERGCTVFNYGRSKRGTGSFDFKRNWGFEPEPLYYQYWLPQGKEMPMLNPINPKYKAAISIWRKAPRWAVNFAGPMLVRGLG